MRHLHPPKVATQARHRLALFRTYLADLYHWILLPRCQAELPQLYPRMLLAQLRLQAGLRQGHKGDLFVMRRYSQGVLEIQEPFLFC